MSRAFVKSADTSTSAVNSRGELEKILLRYGCSGFGVSSDFNTFEIAVTFRVKDTPTKDALEVPVRLKVEVKKVYEALYGRPMMGPNWKPVYDPKGYTGPRLAQAERVAWRHLVLWVDAALSAAAAGMQPVSEAFFAHTLVRDDGGRVERMVDHLNRAAGGNWRALLTAGTGP